jgi:hypothetical protein
MPYIDDIVIGVECVFCPEKSSGFATGTGLQAFVLGHALCMKAIHESLNPLESHLLNFGALTPIS